MNDSVNYLGFAEEKETFIILIIAAWNW